jgi:hypothetical protein
MMPSSPSRALIAPLAQLRPEEVAAVLFHLGRAREEDGEVTVRKARVVGERTSPPCRGTRSRRGRLLDAVPEQRERVGKIGRRSGSC